MTSNAKNVNKLILSNTKNSISTGTENCSRHSKKIKLRSWH